MPLTRLFPLALAVCFAACLLEASADAQTATRQRQVSNPVQLTAKTMVRGAPKLETDVAVVPAPSDEAEPEAFQIKPVVPAAHLGRVEQNLLAAIEERLGTPYRLGATGPNRYDCSGFVWSVFQEAGIDFERMTAHTLWSEFAPATEDEKYKFGTLVFFNNVHHVGIVADANGFYHASTSHGVVYSTFNDYWLKRIVGFRRIPVPRQSSVPALAAVPAH